MVFAFLDGCLAKHAGRARRTPLSEFLAALPAAHILKKSIAEKLDPERFQPFATTAWLRPKEYYALSSSLSVALEILCIHLNANATSF